MSAHWTIADLVDLEYYLERDRDADEATLARRDRRLYAARILPYVSKRERGDRRALMRGWVEALRGEEEEGGLRPGALFTESCALASRLLLVLGIIAGAGAALALLRYHGQEPVNVSGFIALLVLGQGALALLLLLGWLVRRGGRAPRSLLGPVVQTVVARWLARLARSVTDRLGGARRAGLQSVLAFGRRQHAVYGSLLLWPVFTCAQVFGLGFNLGALGATLARVLTTDLAFGWQSTLQVSPPAFHTLVRWLALPWSGLVPGPHAYPSLAQIEGSRIILKDGIHHLATNDLVAWWPFLCLGLVFYGLLPRTIFYIGSKLALRFRLRRLRFRHMACEQVMTRMQAPLLETATGPVIPASTAGVEAAGTARPAETGPAPRPAAALVPVDLAAQYDLATLREGLMDSVRFDVSHRFVYGSSISQDRSLADGLAAHPWAGPPRVLILQEAWQPPIEEHLEFVRAVRRGLPAEAPIHLLLLGRPGDGDPWPAVSAVDQNMWRGAVERLADPFIGVACPGGILV